MSSYVSIPVDDPPPVSHLPRPPPLPFSDQQQQQPQPMELIELPPPLTEERFMEHFMLFSHATGIRLNEQEFYIEGQQVNPWALHRAVFARNGFDSVRISLTKFFFSGIKKICVNYLVHGLGDSE